MKLAVLLAALAALTYHHAALLPLAVLSAAGAVAWCAVWSYRAEPQAWEPPGPNWSGRFA